MNQTTERTPKEEFTQEGYWNTATIGRYFDLSTRHVSERLSVLPNFPKAVRLPSISGGSGQPRWKAKDIRGWGERYMQ